MARAKATKRSDGRYQIKYNNKVFYGKTAREACQKCEDYKSLLASGMCPDARNMTVAMYASQWLPTHKASVGDKTYADYAKQLNVLIKSIGDLYLADVKPEDIKRVYAHYVGYSDSTIKRARIIFNGVFESALENGYIRYNPCRSKDAKPHKGTEGSHRDITDEERALILSSDHWFKPAVMCMLYAGLRRGEVLALNVDDDVDDKKHLLTVDTAVRYDSNQPILSAPKSDAGIRTVPIFTILRPYLYGKHGLLVPRRRDDDLMSESSFKSAWASYIASIECTLNGVTQKRWYGLRHCDQAKDPDRYNRVKALLRDGKKEEADALRLETWKTFSVRPHDLRHSYCVMLRDAGVELKLAMRWMGHADEKMILRIYDHINATRTSEAIQNVESRVSKKVSS